MKKIPAIVLCMVMMAFGADRLAAAKWGLQGYSNFLFLYGKIHKDETIRSFSQNRTNLILTSDFIKKWDFFVNIEFKGRLNLHNDNAEMWEPGPNNKVQLEEAWVKFSVSDAINFRAGQFYAPFGSFNVIQDSAPTYVTVQPPIIYDDDFRERNPVAIIPDKANVAVTGVFCLNGPALEYFVYAGNGKGEIVETPVFHNEYNESFSLGARVCLNYEEALKIGVSTHIDKAYYNNILVNFIIDDTEALKNSLPINFLKDGLVPYEKRFLLSLDLDYTVGPFNINGEFLWNRNRHEQMGNFNRIFYYVNANAEILHKVRLYAEYDSYKDNMPIMQMRNAVAAGITRWVAGINYKPDDFKIAVKAEIQRFGNEDSTDKWGDELKPWTVFIAGLSIAF